MRRPSEAAVWLSLAGVTNVGTPGGILAEGAACARMGSAAGRAQPPLSGHPPGAGGEPPTACRRAPRPTHSQEGRLALNRSPGVFAHFAPSRLYFSRDRPLVPPDSNTTRPGRPPWALRSQQALQHGLVSQKRKSRHREPSPSRATFLLEPHPLGPRFLSGRWASPASPAPLVPG